MFPALGGTQLPHATAALAMTDTDIVKRLRRQASQQDMLTCEDMLQAADEIERREAAIRRLDKALVECQAVRHYDIRAAAGGAAMLQEISALEAEVERLLDAKGRMRVNLANVQADNERLTKMCADLGQAAMEMGQQLKAKEAKIEQLKAILTNDPTPAMIDAGRLGDPLSCDVNEGEMVYVYTQIWKSMACRALEETK